MFTTESFLGHSLLTHCAVFIDGELMMKSSNLFFPYFQRVNVLRKHLLNGFYQSFNKAEKW